MTLLIAPLLFAATFCFALGITLPLIEIDRLWLFSEHPSLIGIVTGLWDAGDIALSALIACFSLALPALKLMLVHLAAFNGSRSANRITRWLHALARWSMLDVVLVAIVIFAAKTSGLATAISQPGLWFFAASVVMTATASSLADRKQDSS
jgi:paraquat-inducible protein A